TRIHQSTWWWQSNFELIREAGHELMTETERRPNTMIALLEAQTAPVRLLVARFAADTAAGLAYLNTDPELRVHGTDPNDNFEVMLQANPTPAPLLGVYDATPITVDFGARVRANPAFAERTFAEDAGVIEAALETFDGSSYHQKCLTVGDSIAYISGMNVKSTDWDTAEHLVFDHRRMVFDATAEERAAVVARTALPDKGPRKDYGIRIEGPAARDVDDVMRVRWDLGIATSAMFEGDATAYDLLDPGAVKGTTTVQVVATMPDPVAERSILESQAKAVSQATDLIYIEDQYFRAPVLDVVIADAMERNPNLALIVVTKPIALTDGGKKWTVISDNIFRSRFPDRYLLLQLKNFDREDGEVYVQALDVHSKIITVDDVYLSTGSANKNNRGMLYEGELNAAVHSQAFVAPARQRILANLVGSDYAASLDGATGKQILELMRTLSEENEAFVQAVLADPEKVGTPSGFVYPLEFSEEYLLEVGPDVF
ncbi:MAG: phosphatidylserine/phosphatidylglycerophosphate/cardiolipin synthase-like enzyme, partial [Myxococcota bacterium]